LDRLADELARELARFGPQVAIGKVVETWPAAVGEQIARNAWPARVARDGTLLVHTCDAIWAFELTQQGEEIRTRLGVERIRFVPGPLPERSAETSDTTAERMPEPTSEDVRAGNELAAEIDDEKLRKLVARAAAASLAKARNDQ
jgi:hypothetical protein